MSQYKIEINGNVQGVGYRFFVQKKAKELGINGWVKNTPDGDVVVMAKGNDKDIKLFVEQLKIGSSDARVENLEKSKVKEIEEFSGFFIRY